MIVFPTYLHLILHYRPGLQVMSALAEEKVKLSCVITTHHHWDHAGGNEKFIALHGKVPVYGGDDRVGALTDKVVHDSRFKVL